MPLHPAFHARPTGARLRPVPSAVLIALAACALLATATRAPAAPRPGTVEESAAQRAAARPPVRFQRAIDLLPGAAVTARAWASDAALAWVENADSLAADGSSRAWTFVWIAGDRGETRAFTFADSGRVTSVALPSAFAPPRVEDGWIEPSALVAGFAGDAATRSAIAGADVAVLSRGLLPGGAGNATSWYVGRVRGPGATFDALRGATFSTAGPGLVGDVAAAPAAGVPAFLAAHQAALLTRLEKDRAAARTERTRGAAAREAAALARLGATQASLDTLGRAAVAAAGADVDRALAGLAAWRADEARADSVLAASEARLAAAERDLAADRPTEFALYLVLERRARPAVLRVLVDGAEVTRRAYGAAEWNALDAGAWSEVTRAAARPGAREVRVEIEGADRRVATATWSGDLPAGTMTLLRLALRGAGEGGEAPPRLERLAGTTP